MAMPYTGAMPQNPFGQPQLPDWLNQSQPLNAMSPAPLDLQVPKIKRGGMFGGKGAAVGDAIVGALNGYLAGMGNPAGVQGLQQLHQQRMLQQQQALAEQQYQRERTDKRDDFTFEQDYRAAHAQPGEFEQTLIASGIQPGTPAWTHAMQQRRDNQLDPIVITPQGPMLRSQVVGAMSAGQPAPPDVTFTPYEEGGQTPPASGVFPDPLAPL